MNRSEIEQLARQITQKNRRLCRTANAWFWYSFIELPADARSETTRILRRSSNSDHQERLQNSERDPLGFRLRLALEMVDALADDQDDHYANRDVYGLRYHEIDSVLFDIADMLNLVPIERVSADFDGRLILADCSDAYRNILIQLLTLINQKNRK